MTGLVEPIVPPSQDESDGVLRDVVDASVGRQLFIDDFLIATSTLGRTWFRPETDAGNPLMSPTDQEDMNQGISPVAAPFDDGIVYDDSSRTWRVWYMSGWFEHTRSRQSVDGVRWTDTPAVSLTGLTTGDPDGLVQRDGSAVCLDYSTGRRLFRMFRYARRRPPHFDATEPHRHAAPVERAGGELFSSDDGVHWTYEGAAGPGGDNTTFFYDPFRARWVFSIRTELGPFGRGRGWHEGATFAEAGAWSAEQVVPWISSHGFESDPPVGDMRSSEIYKVTCMPYESVMLGIFAVYRGPSNSHAEFVSRRPKIIDLYLGVSRDGYHYSVARRPLLRSSRIPGSWDYGYLHMVNGGILPVADDVRIYYSAFSGLSPALGWHMYAGGAMGMARLRRDGFCAMTPAGGRRGRLTTVPLRVRGNHLWLNIKTGREPGRVVVHDPAGSGSRVHLLPAGTDSTRLSIEICPDGAEQERMIRIEFELEGEAELYSFWVSDRFGRSHGYSASGPVEDVT